MKSVSILISNLNSFEAIQLCVESVRKHTKYPDYKIIVYDDTSWNKVDLAYLRIARNQGWLKLIEGETRVGHGGSVNALLEACNTDLAMILDTIHCCPIDHIFVVTQ